MIDEQLYSFLSTNTAITDACPRIYGVDAPADVTLPLITYAEYSNYRTRSWDGVNQQIQSNLTIDVWAKSKIEAADIANVILDELEDYAGLWGTKTIQQVDIGGAVLSYDAEQAEYGCSIDVEVWYF